MTPVYDAALLLSERPAAHFWVMFFFFLLYMTWISEHGIGEKGY